MSNYYIYRYSKVINEVSYRFDFHFGGKTGSYLGVIQMPPDSYKDFELDVAMEDERLTGIELARSLKVTFNVEGLYDAYGSTFLDNLFRGSEETNEDIAIPISDYVSMNVNFDFPNRMVVYENTGSGNIPIFDGVQKIEFGEKKYDDDLQIEFICSGAWILQNMLLTSPYIILNYASMTYYDDYNYNQTMQGDAYLSSENLTHVIFDYVYSSTGVCKVEQSIHTRPSVVFGSQRIKDVIDRVNLVGNIYYDAIVRYSTSGGFVLSNSDSDNLLIPLVLYSQVLTATTSSQKNAIISYNARLITAIFDFYKPSTTWEIYQSDNMLIDNNTTNIYDWIKKWLEMSCSKATFTYGNDQVKLNWHYAKKSRFSGSQDTPKSYAIKPFTKRENLDMNYKPVSETNIFVPGLSNNGDVYLDGNLIEKTFNSPKTRRSNAPTNELNLSYHNLSLHPYGKIRKRRVKGATSPAFRTTFNKYAMYQNFTLNSYTALIRLHEYCQIKLDDSTILSSTDTAQSLPFKNPSHKYVNPSDYARLMKTYIDTQQKVAGLPYTIGLAYNKLYSNNTRLDIEVDDLFVQDFGKTLTLSDLSNLGISYISNKIPSTYVCVGVKTKFDGKYLITLVSV